MAVLDHMRERLARLDVAGEGQEHRPDGVFQLGIGDDHVEDRLRFGRDLIPYPDGIEQAPARRDDGGRARVAARPGGQRRVGDDDRDVGAEALTQRQRQRQPGKGASADNNASLCRHRNLLAIPLPPDYSWAKQEAETRGCVIVIPGSFAKSGIGAGHESRKSKALPCPKA